MSWRVRTRVGETIWGKTTYGQVDDYVRVCEHDNAQLDQAIAGCKAWIASDPLGFQAFNERADAVSKELPGLVRRVHDARPPLPADTDAIEAGTQAAFDALRDWRKRLNALYGELAANPHGCTLPAPTPEPQPTAQDPQLDAYKEAHHATDTIEHVEEKVAEGAKAVARVALPIGVGIAVAAVGLVTLVAFARK